MIADSGNDTASLTQGLSLQLIESMTNLAPQGKSRQLVSQHQFLQQHWLFERYCIPNTHNNSVLQVGEAESMSIFNEKLTELDVMTEAFQTSTEALNSEQEKTIIKRHALVNRALAVKMLQSTLEDRLADIKVRSDALTSKELAFKQKDSLQRMREKALLAEELDIRTRRSEFLFDLDEYRRATAVLRGLMQSEKW